MAPWDGSGNIQRTNGTNSGTTVWQDDRDDGVNIRADRHDTHDEDLANSLENTVALDGQTTTTTDNSLLWYHGTNNRFEGFEVVANRIVGRKASGDVGALTPAEGRTVLSVYSQAEVDSYSPTAVTDGGTDAFTGNFGTDVSAGETVSGDFGSANTTTTPTLENTGGTPGALTITTKDGSALWAGALSGVHNLQLNAGGTAWLVPDPNPLIPASTQATSSNTANAIVQRDANGRFKASDPSASQDVATKASSEAYADAGDPTLATAVDATNGGANNLTEIDFTGIKSGAKRILVVVDQISASGTDTVLIQLGDSGGVETSGYNSVSGVFSSPSQEVVSSTNGFVVWQSGDSNVTSFVMELVRYDGNVWVGSHCGQANNNNSLSGGGTGKQLSGELDRIRITTSGTNTFDSGNVNILVE